MRQWVKYMQNQAYAPPMKQAADLLRALADEERLRIINLLSDEPEGACVCELVDALRMPQYQVSRQLGVLRQADLVEAHKRGNWVYYSIRPDLPPLAAIMLEDLFAHLQSQGGSEDRERFARRLRLREGGVCSVGYPPETPYREVIPLRGGR